VRSGARRRTAATGAAALLAVATLLAGCSGSSAPADDPEVAEAGYQAGDGSITLFAPADRTEAVELAGVTFDGVELDLADYRGDVVLLNFWYADCPPCRVEAPDLAALATDYADRGLRVVGINARDDADRVASFTESFGITYPMLEDSDASAVSALQGVVPLSAYPTTVVLDREGRPAARVLGLTDAATLGGLVDDVLAESSRG